MTTRAPRCRKALSALPACLFADLEESRREAARPGRTLIDLGTGNPDRPAPVHVVDALCRAVREDSTTHRYPETRGCPALRRAIAAWCRRRFALEVDPETEVLPLLGSKEGLAHLSFAYLEPGDYALVPSPCYPAHQALARLCGASVHPLPLTARRGFLPDLDSVPNGVAKKTKLLFLNYPHNPTGAVLTDTRLFESALDFVKASGGFIAHDNSYCETCFDGYRAPAFLQVPGAREHGVEFFSLSPAYSMAGWRVGFAVGNASILASLAKLKSLVDYGVPGFVQAAAVAALEGSQDYPIQIAEIYRQRRDVLVARLNAAGWPVDPPRATMYLWARLPLAFRAGGSVAFCRSLLVEEGVVLAPGAAFGPQGEGYVRFACVEDERRIEEAAARVARFLKKSKAHRP